MFRSAYAHRDEQLHQGIVFEEPSLTDQSQYKDTDINNIVRRYQTTGLLDSPGAVPFETLQYGDATLLPDYQTALDLVNSVQTEFSSLPSDVREKFGHDPMQLLDALQDPTKQQMLQDIGLLSKPANPNLVPDQPILKDEVPPVNTTNLTK